MLVPYFILLAHKSISEGKTTKLFSFSLIFIQQKCHGIAAKVYLSIHIKLCALFVCVEVLRPSQPNGVMSSAVSLPNHTFTGQA